MRGGAAAALVGGGQGTDTNAVSTVDMQLREAEKKELLRTPPPCTLSPPLPLVGLSIGNERGCPQNRSEEEELLRTHGAVIGGVGVRPGGGVKQQPGEFLQPQDIRELKTAALKGQHVGRVDRVAPSLYNRSTFRTTAVQGENARKGKVCSRRLCAAAKGSQKRRAAARTNLASRRAADTEYRILLEFDIERDGEAVCAWDADAGLTLGLRPRLDSYTCVGTPTKVKGGG